jgi:hypothetical protein
LVKYFVVDLVATIRGNPEPQNAGRGWPNFRQHGELPETRSSANNKTEGSEHRDACDFTASNGAG